MTEAIDLFVNPNMAALANDKLVRDVNDTYFRTENLFRDISVDDLLSTMNDAGVAHAVISIDAETPDARLLDFSRSHPESFSLAAWVNIDHGVEAVWALRDLVKREKVVMARVMPSTHDKPPTHASYYPLFAKCAEIDLPVSVLTGIPGPRLDAASQDPIHLDRVCRDFPMLTVIMTHGADPWWETAIRLMMKYPKLYLMTSAWLPKYLPAALISFMNTRGREKVMWASDHPVIDMKRSIAAASILDLRAGIKERYLYENARCIFKF